MTTGVFLEMYSNFFVNFFAFNSMLSLPQQLPEDRGNIKENAML